MQLEDDFRENAGEMLLKTVDTASDAVKRLEKP